MNTFTQEQIIESGGNLWEKGSMKRIYMNDESLTKLVGFKKVEHASYADEFTGLGKSKLWFDCVKNVFLTDSGTVRTLLNNNGIKCAKV